MEYFHDTRYPSMGDAARFLLLAFEAIARQVSTTANEQECQA